MNRRAHTDRAYLAAILLLSVISVSAHAHAEIMADLGAGVETVFIDEDADEQAQRPRRQTQPTGFCSCFSVGGRSTVRTVTTYVGCRAIQVRRYRGTAYCVFRGVRLPPNDLR